MQIMLYAENDKLTLFNYLVLKKFFFFNWMKGGVNQWLDLLYWLYCVHLLGFTFFFIKVYVVYYDLHVLYILFSVSL